MDDAFPIALLVRWLYSTTDFATWAEFARHARVSEYLLSEWRSGRTAPNAQNLLRLLLATNMLAPELRAYLESDEEERSA